MSEIVNLRQARKRVDRAKREEIAAANRAKFGQSKAERAATKAVAEKLDTTLNGARIDDAE